MADAYNIAPGTTVTFDGRGSSDPDGDPLTYEWLLGVDTLIGTEAIITYTFTLSGDFPVTLMVTDDDARNPLSGGMVDVIRVNAAPVADFTMNPDPTQTPVSTGEPINFDGSLSYDPDGFIPINAYYWDFGDSSNATGQIVLHTYMMSITYYVTLTVTDDQGVNDTKQVEIYIEPE